MASGGKIFRQACVIVLVAAAAAFASAFFRPALVSHPALAPDETTWDQIAAWQRAGAPRILLIDARPADAYHAAHAPGALSLNEPHWERLLPDVIEALDDNPRVAVYCDDRLCEASRGVADRLRRELALTDVFVIKDGWEGWLQTYGAAAAESDLAKSPAP